MTKVIDGSNDGINWIGEIDSKEINSFKYVRIREKFIEKLNDEEMFQKVSMELYDALVKTYNTLIDAIPMDYKGDPRIIKLFEDNDKLIKNYNEIL